MAAGATPLLVRCLALSLVLAVAATARSESPDPRIEAAELVYRQQGAAAALPMFEKLAGEYTRGSRTRATPDQAAALHYVGECYWRLGRYRESKQHLDRALALEAAAGDRLAEGRTRNVRGLLAWDEARYDDAIEDLKLAGELARAAGDRKLEGSALNNLSLVYDELGDYDTSLRQYERVLALYRGIDFPRGVGDTLGNIGGVHLLLGHFREALGYYRQALAISEKLESPAALSQDHGNAGLCLLGLGDVEAALAHLDQAIHHARQAGMRQDAAYWMRARGEAHVVQGRYDLALDDYRVALAVYQDLEAPAELLEALHARGELHLLLGDSASAERDLRRALDTARDIGLERGVTTSLLALGDLELRRKRHLAAATHYEEARRRAAATSAQAMLGVSLLRLARVDRDLGKLEQAASATSEGLAIAHAIASPALEAEAMYSRAEIARLTHQWRASIGDHDAARRVASRTGDPDLLWRIFLGRARAQHGAGDDVAAIDSLESAADLIEGVRARLREPRYRSGYLEDKFEVYLELMQLQLRQGSTDEAFETAERLRARSFVEQLGGRASTPLSPQQRRKEAELLERARRLRESLEEKDEEGAPTYTERARQRFSAELARAEAEYQAFLDDNVGPVRASASVSAVTAVQFKLGPRQALVEYVVGGDSIVAFVVTAGDVVAITTPARATDLAARVSLLRDLVRRPGDSNWREVAARLAADVLAPIERARLLDRVDELYIVPHGALTYVPFALLPRSSSTGAKALLIDRYTIAYLPASAALLQKASRSAGNGTMLAVAPARSGLRYAAQEAQAVEAMFRPNARKLIGTEATEGRFKELVPQYRMLHLATHGHFNPLNPLLSGLELEPDAHDDGMLRVHEIVDLRLHASLVTLSACDTALGSGYFAALPAGEDFIGLNRAFLAAGSTAVLATLWQVDDRASVTVMQRFYPRLGSADGALHTAQALAQAQRELRQAPQFAHPYYWAAYVVVGPLDAASGTARQASRRTT